MNWPSHGSNPQYLYKTLGIAFPKKFIDFSANINPCGPPYAVKENWNHFFQEITVYPDPFAMKLKEIIAIKEQIPVESLLIGNGGAELITLVARMLARKKVLIVQPSFSEYETACRVNHCEILYYQLKDSEFELNFTDIRSRIASADALFLCNPNNPTGIQFPAQAVISIIEECEKQNCIVILDEAFYDFLQEYQSFISYIHRFSNLIVIRSMTKMFAIPGIRLGYLAAPANILEKLRPLQPHWSVNTLALLVGEICLADEAFVHRTRDFIDQERKRLFDFYHRHQFIVSPSKVNFYLLRDPLIREPFMLFKFLLNEGIVPRHTFNFPGLDGRWLRFAIKSEEENSRLMEVLAQWRTVHH